MPLQLQIVGIEAVDLRGRGWITKLCKNSNYPEHLEPYSPPVCTLFNDNTCVRCTSLLPKHRDTILHLQVEMIIDSARQCTIKSISCKVNFLLCSSVRVHCKKAFIHFFCRHFIRNGLPVEKVKRLVFIVCGLVINNLVLPLSKPLQKLLGIFPLISMGVNHACRSQAKGFCLHSLFSLQVLFLSCPCTKGVRIWSFIPMQGKNFRANTSSQSCVRMVGSWSMIRASMCYSNTNSEQ